MQEITRNNEKLTRLAHEFEPLDINAVEDRYHRSGIRYDPWEPVSGSGPGKYIGPRHCFATIFRAATFLLLKNETFFRTRAQIEEEIVVFTKRTMYTQQIHHHTRHSNCTRSDNEHCLASLLRGS